MIDAVPIQSLAVYQFQTHSVMHANIIYCVSPAAIWRTQLHDHHLAPNAVDRCACIMVL